MQAIKTVNLSRTYRSYIKPEGLMNSFKGFFKRQYLEKAALAPTNLNIESGQIVGLVGANGAGKTTLLKLLSGLIYPSTGSAQILGFSPWDRKRDFFKNISILLGQKNQLWWDIPPLDSYELLTKIYELDSDQARKRVYELADILGCISQLETQLRRLSLGERMKMEIIASLLHKPKVLFLDEPTIGLDIMAQSTIRHFLSEYVQKEKPTIILTSHYMDDISKLSHRLLLISQGNIVYEGSVHEFMSRSVQKQKISLKLQHPPQQDVSLFGNHKLEANKNIFSVEVPEEQVSPILQNVIKISPIYELKVEESNFEDVVHEFLKKDTRLL